MARPKVKAKPKPKRKAKRKAKPKPKVKAKPKPKPKPKAKPKPKPKPPKRKRKRGALYWADTELPPHVVAKIEALDRSKHYLAVVTGNGPKSPPREGELQAFRAEEEYQVTFAGNVGYLADRLESAQEYSDILDVEFHELDRPLKIAGRPLFQHQTLHLSDGRIFRGIGESRRFRKQRVLRGPSKNLPPAEYRKEYDRLRAKDKRAAAFAKKARETLARGDKKAYRTMVRRHKAQLLRWERKQ